MSDSSKYSLRGVSAGKEEVHAAIRNSGKGRAGTKSSLAYLYWKETGDLSVWKGIAQDAVVMNTDDLLCVGSTGPMILSSTIGRNKLMIPGEVITALIEGTEEFLETLRSFGLEIYSSGGETADVGDLVRTIIVDSTVIARMPRSEVISNDGIRPGDVIVGLSSSGRASYESSYNSGMGSNGLTSARHDLLHQLYKSKYPESLDPGMPDELAYSGPFRVTDPSPVDGIDIGKLILSPTRTYAPVIAAVLGHMRGTIHGMVHCSGGGQTKVLHFVDNISIVKDRLFEIPPLFRLIREYSGSSWKEMYRVFNMGHRMEIYLEEKHAAEVIAIAGSFGVEARVIGHCESSATKSLTLVTPEGPVTY